ncbi:hypothetical protein D3C73_1323250 [compost metagenome]
MKLRLVLTDLTDSANIDFGLSIESTLSPSSTFLGYFNITPIIGVVVKPSIASIS